jgi:hypothetical protein
MGNYNSPSHILGGLATQSELGNLNSPSHVGQLDCETMCSRQSRQHNHQPVMGYLLTKHSPMYWGIKIPHRTCLGGWPSKVRWGIKIPHHILVNSIDTPLVSANHVNPNMNM